MRPVPRPSKVWNAAMGCLRRLWRTAIEIRASFSETSAEPPHYAIPWALLKQPDKHKSSTGCDTRAFVTNSGVFANETRKRRQFSLLKLNMLSA